MGAVGRRLDVRGARRRGAGRSIHFDGGAGRGFGGAGTIHHIAWATQLDEHAAWRERIADAGR